MENFNLDNLERKNIYKTPENLFEKVQENVLKNVSLEAKKQELQPAKIFNMSWAMGIAAAFVAIFGILWFVTTNNETETKIDTIVKAEIPHNPVESKQAYATLKSDIVSTENTDENNHSDVKPELIASNTQEKSSTKEENNTIKIEKATTKSQKTEEHINAYLDALPKGEVAELASNSVSDVYLDLYN